MKTAVVQYDRGTSVTKNSKKLDLATFVVLIVVLAVAADVSQQPLLKRLQTLQSFMVVVPVAHPLLFCCPIQLLV